MNIQINGKTYKYNFFQVYSRNNANPYYSTTSEPNVSLRNKNFKQYESDIIPLFSFLELPRQATTLQAKIDGLDFTLTVAKTSGLDDIYYAGFRRGNYTLTFYEPVTIQSSSNVGTAGTAIGYNYATDTFVSLSGGQAFSITEDSKFHLYYENEIFGGHALPSLPYNQLLQGGVYQSKFYPAGWSNAKFEVQNSFTSFMKSNDWSLSKYPDNPDDPENPDDDPTDPTPGIGDGTSDPIPVPPKPTTDVTGTGFVTLYNPSVIAIRDLAYFMWSGDFADLLKKIFRAPFDCLIGLKLIYAPLITGATQKIWLGNVETTVSAPKIADQFIDFDCGELSVTEYFGSFLDYTPYTKISIFLPFIGYKQLNVDEVMNATLHLTYRIDAYSGACIAFLKVTKGISSTNLDSVLYSFDGNCAMDIPFTAGDMTRYVAAILGTAASTAGAVISNPMPSEAPLNNETDATKNPNEKHLSDLGNTSANLVAAKPQIQRGGSLAGANSSMGIKQPYIIIERPLQQMPYNYPNYIGIPLNMTKKLSQVTGFTVVSDIFMASSQATDEEIKIIISKLKQGVVF